MHAVTIDIPQPALVLLIGPSGAGKSTFARAHFRATQIVSSDDLRAAVSDDPNDQAASADAFRILELLLNGRLKRRLTAVVDATNLRAANRRRLCSIAARYGVPAVAIVFDFADHAYFANNARRPDRRVREDVVEAQVERLRQAIDEIPSEGYTAIHIVREADQPERVVAERSPRVLRDR